MLRQIRQAMARKGGGNALAGLREKNAGKGLQERALPGPVWTDDGRQARGRKLTGQALKRVSFAIAHGKIANRDPFLSATTVSVGRAGIVAAIEMTGEGSLRVIPQRRERNGEGLPERCGGCAHQADHVGDRPTSPHGIRRGGHYTSG